MFPNTGTMSPSSGVSGACACAGGVPPVAPMDTGLDANPGYGAFRGSGVGAFGGARRGSGDAPRGFGFGDARGFGSGAPRGFGSGDARAGAPRGSDAFGGARCGSDAFGDARGGSDAFGDARGGSDAFGGARRGFDAFGGARADVRHGSDAFGGARCGSDAFGGARAGAPRGSDAFGGARCGSDAFGDARGGSDAFGGARCGSDAFGDARGGSDAFGARRGSSDDEGSWPPGAIPHDIGAPEDELMDWNLDNMPPKYPRPYVLSDPEFVRRVQGVAGQCVPYLTLARRPPNGDGDGFYVERQAQVQLRCRACGGHLRHVDGSRPFADLSCACGPWEVKACRGGHARRSMESTGGHEFVCNPATTLMVLFGYIPCPGVIMGSVVGSGRDRWVREFTVYDAGVLMASIRAQWLQIYEAFERGVSRIPIVLRGLPCATIPGRGDGRGGGRGGGGRRRRKRRGGGRRGGGGRRRR